MTFVSMTYMTQKSLVEIPTLDLCPKQCHSMSARMNATRKVQLPAKDLNTTRNWWDVSWALWHMQKVKTRDSSEMQLTGSPIHVHTQVGVTVNSYRVWSHKDVLMIITTIMFNEWSSYLPNLFKIQYARSLF